MISKLGHEPGTKAIYDETHGPGSGVPYYKTSSLLAIVLGVGDPAVQTTSGISLRCIVCGTETAGGRLTCSGVCARRYQARQKIGRQRGAP